MNNEVETKWRNIYSTNCDGIVVLVYLVEVFQWRTTPDCTKGSATAKLAATNPKGSQAEIDGRSQAINEKHWHLNQNVKVCYWKKRQESGKPAWKISRKMELFRDKLLLIKSLEKKTTYRCNCPTSEIFWRPGAILYVHAWISKKDEATDWSKC